MRVKTSRGGRKRLMLAAMQSYDKRFSGGCLVTAKLAHAAGLKSSTEVVKMLREMVADGLIKEVQIEPSYNCGYTVRAWQYVRWVQMTLQDHVISINGKADFLTF